MLRLGSENLYLVTALELVAQRHELVVDLGTDAMTAKESVYLECKIECRASGRHSLYLALGGEDEDFGRE